MISIGIEAEFGGRRYAQAVRGVEALARDTEIAVADLQPFIRRHLKDVLDSVVLALQRRHSTPWAPNSRLPSGRAGQLHRRSGRAMGELSATVEEVGSSVVGRITGPFYLVTHEEGRVIRARRAQWLTIPLPAALTARGTPRRSSARQWRNTFVIQSKKGNLLIVQKRAGGIVPLYVLRKQVTIPPRLGLGDSVRVAAPVVFDRITEEIRRRARNA